jgi:phospholipase D1/2
LFGAQLIGIASVPVEKVMTGELVKSWFPLVQQSGEPIKTSESTPELHISLQYKPIETDSLYGRGIGAGPNYSGVPNAYFPLRKGGKVMAKT